MAGKRIRTTLTIALALALGACAHRRPPTTVAPSAPGVSTPTYSALGGGHLLKSVSDNGRLVTLEDGSVWEIFPNDRFQTADWQASAPVTVRTTRGQDGYTYEIVNTQDDEGAMAKFVEAGKRE